MDSTPKDKRRHQNGLCGGICPRSKTHSIAGQKALDCTSCCTTAHLASHPTCTTHIIPVDESNVRHPVSYMDGSNIRHPVSYMDGATYGSPCRTWMRAMYGRQNSGLQGQCGGGDK
ncbi:hypothetical protein Vretifemale_13765, partial [Volvox reticuliferus]